MTEDLIIRLFREKGLGTVLRPIEPISGGFLHRMYRVDTESGAFAVKHLNPNIMKRPEAPENFKRAEELEKVLEDAGVPIVPAIEFGGSKMQELGGEYFYVFRWQNGKTTDWHDTASEQCRIAGRIQGMIHAIAPKAIAKAEPRLSAVDWEGYIRDACEAAPEIAGLLEENTVLLHYAESELNRARAALPGIECIVDEDMDPKNVMWDGDEPYVIDLECLEWGNPVSSALQLSLQWAGAVICDLDFVKLHAFFDGYFSSYDNGFRDYASVFGLAYTWIEWLEYNIKRALGGCMDESEREMGISQVRLTVERIRYLYEKEGSIKRHLAFEADRTVFQTEQ